MFNILKEKPLLLGKKEVISDLLCDTVLKILYDFVWQERHLNDLAVRDQLQTVGITCTRQQVTTVLFILKSEGFTKVQDAELVTWTLTFEGLAFLNTDTFTRRSNRRLYENGAKEFAYHTRWAPLMISLLALLISLKDCKKTNKNDNREQQQEQQHLQPAVNNVQEHM